MRADIIKKAKDILASRKLNAELTADKNLKKALNNEAFKVNYFNLKTLMIDIAKGNLGNMSEAEANELYNVLKKQQSTLLKSMNMRTQDIEPHYHCNKCNDTGIVNDDYCECYKMIVNDLFRQENKSELIGKYTFESSDPSKLPDKVKEYYKKFESWADRFPDIKIHNIVLQGNTGTGKTYLASSICNRLTSRNFTIQSYTAFGFNNLMLKYHTSFDETRGSIIESVLDCDVLYIDDLGSENILKNVTIEYLFLVLNERLIKNKSTIITTNLTPDQILNRYGERVFSRLMNKSNSVLVKLDGEDMRLKRK